MNGLVLRTHASTFGLSHHLFCVRFENTFKEKGPVFITQGSKKKEQKISKKIAPRTMFGEYLLDLLPRDLYSRQSNFYQTFILRF